MRVNSLGLGEVIVFVEAIPVDVEEKNKMVWVCIEAVELVHWCITVRTRLSDLWHSVRSLFGFPFALFKVFYLLLKGVLVPRALSWKCPLRCCPLLKRMSREQLKEWDPSTYKRVRR